MHSHDEASVQTPETPVDADTSPPIHTSSGDERLADIAAEVGDLPGLPDIAMRVFQMAEGDEWNVADLEQEIRRDQALTARFLRLANSAHYGARRTVGSLNQALTMLGSKKIRTVLLAAAVEGFHQATHSNFEDRVLWQHALAVGFVSQHLAQQLQLCNPEEAFIAGLLHDIGRVVMDERVPSQYQRVVDRVNESDESLGAAEREVFGYDHTQVGFLLATAWALPDAIADTIRWHHEPEAAQSDHTLCATVSLANSWCVKNELGPDARPDLVLAELASAEMLHVDESKIDELTDNLLESVRRFLTV